MPQPIPDAVETRSREIFLALMNALSYPGRPFELPAGLEGDGHHGLASLADTLLDLESSVFTPDPDLARTLARTGARVETPDAAEFHVYSSLGDSEIDPVSRASVGTLIDPDRSATLIVRGSERDGLRLRLTGPGINGSIEIRPGGLPGWLWRERERSRRFPLGWDLFVLVGGRVIGIPRSAAVEILDEPAERSEAR